MIQKKSRTRATAIVVNNDQILAFKAIDPHNKKEYFFLPGGAIEPHETADEAAARETEEETGYSVVIDTASCVDKEYKFLWNNEEYDCLTLFYRAHLKSPFQIPQAQRHKEPDYHKGVQWIPVLQIKEAFNYCPEVRDAIFEILAQNQ